MKVLFYRRGGLGDTLLCFPVLELLKRKNFHITAVGNTDYFEIAKEVGWVDEVYSSVPNAFFDEKIFISQDGLSPFPSKREWIVYYYLKSLKLQTDFSYTLPIRANENSVLKDKVLIAPSSGSSKKNLSPELFKNIEAYLTDLGYEVVYIVGEADGWLKEHVDKYYEIKSVLDFAKDLKLAKYYIGTDSGISHLSAYLGVKSFVFFGPTDSIVWHPIGKSLTILSLNLECSPCFPNTCPDMSCLKPSSLYKLFVRAFKNKT